MSDYLAEALEPDQTSPIPGSNQVENSAGGYVYGVDPWTRLQRFLILGSEGGSFYASEQDLTFENVECLDWCTEEDPHQVVDAIVGVSLNGRAAQNDPAIFALAYASSYGTPVGREYALSFLSAVCRTGTHLFTFLDYVTRMRGWGRGLRNAVSQWYTDMNPDKLALQLVKYRNRKGWTHRDALRCAHPRAVNSYTNDLLYFASQETPTQESVEGRDMPPVIRGFLKAREEEPSSQDMADWISSYSLPREAVPSEYLKDSQVWAALLETMPVTAMIRNLGNMSKAGLLKPLSASSSHISNVLTNENAIQRSMVHPIQVLAALITYSQGHGARGSGTWNVDPTVEDALEQAFKLSFGNCSPTNKRTMLALDVSPSMEFDTINSIPSLTPRAAAAAMALITAKTENQYDIMAFAEDFVKLGISGRSSFKTAMQAANKVRWSATDCALPMIYALENNLEVDVFQVYTDSETFAGKVHPMKALQKYRKESGIAAKLVVVGMVANDFTIADPNDAGSLDVVGFDTSTPNIIHEFATGKI